MGAGALTLFHIVEFLRDVEAVIPLEGRRPTSVTGRGGRYPTPACTRQHTVTGAPKIFGAAQNLELFPSFDKICIQNKWGGNESIQDFSCSFAGSICLCTCIVFARGMHLPVRRHAQRRNKSLSCQGQSNGTDQVHQHDEFLWRDGVFPRVRVPPMNPRIAFFIWYLPLHFGLFDSLGQSGFFTAVVLLFYYLVTRSYREHFKFCNR
jgi:hypothetical protein